MLARSRAAAIVTSIGGSSFFLFPFLFLFPSSCKDRSHAPPAPAAAATAEAAAPAPPSSALPPLDSNWLVRIPLEGFGNAVIAAPTGTTSPRPILVGVHGIHDRPEWVCGEFLGITRGYPFILCPHGIPADAAPNEMLGFANAADLKREIDAGVEALRARFGTYVAEGPMMYGGFSRGAFLGVTIVSDEPARFPVVILGEGGQTSWTPERASRFARGGGKRVLFECSTAACDEQTPRARAILEEAGVEVKMVSPGHIGHIVDDRVVTVIREAWPWLVRDRTGALGPW